MGVTNSATSNNHQQQMVLGEQSPFYQQHAGFNHPSPFVQHSGGIAGINPGNGNESVLGTTHSVVSMSHPSSSMQLMGSSSNNPLLNMEPFSTNHIQFSQSAQSVIHSNLPSRKGSFHSDDSLDGGSPHGTTMTNPNAMIFGNAIPENIPRFAIPSHFALGAGGGAGVHGYRVPMESNMSVFSRQSTTHFKSNYGLMGGGNHTHTATASIACNEGGPIGLRE